MNGEHTRPAAQAPTGTQSSLETRHALAPADARLDEPPALLLVALHLNSDHHGAGATHQRSLMG